MRVLILGGYGLAGRAIATGLLRETDCTVALAGRSQQRAADAASELAESYGDARVEGLRVDAADAASVREAACGFDLVIVASSTTARAGTVAESVLEAGADYLDVQLSEPAKIQALRALEPRIEASGRCFITDGGFHPGVPGVLIRAAAGRIPDVTEAHVGSVVRMDGRSLPIGPATRREFVTELASMRPMALRAGRWVRLPWSDARRFDFGRPYGERTCIPVELEEVRTVAEHVPSLRDAGFHIAGFNPVTDYLAIPLAMAAGPLRRALAAPLGRLLAWSFRFTRPPFGTALRVEASDAASTNTWTLTVGHEDLYRMTAIPVIACLLQVLDGSARRPGLWLQASLVEPERFLFDLERMGLDVVREP